MDTITIPPPPSPREMEAEGTESQDSASSSGKKKKFQSKLVKEHFEEKYGIIREGSNPLSGKKVGDMEIITPERLSRSQGTGKPGLRLNIDKLKEDGSAEGKRERSKSASKKSRLQADSKDPIEAQRPLSARELVRRGDSSNSFTSSTSSGSIGEKEEEPAARVRARAASISKRETPTFNNALDWLLVAQGGTADSTEDSEDIEKHNAEVRRKRDEEFAELQRQREQRRLKKEEKDRKRKERQRERARILVETGTDPGSLSSSESSSD